MADFTADHISTEESTELLKAAQAELIGESDSGVRIRSRGQLSQSAIVPWTACNARTVFIRNSVECAA